MLDKMASLARDMARQPGFAFEDYGRLFSGLDRANVARMFEQILREILEATADREQPYDDQAHLVSDGDFNLTLRIVGRPAEILDHITASEFDMLAVNLTGDPVALPVYRTTIDAGSAHERPGPLIGPERVTVGPYGWRKFSAYAETADLAGADREAPFLVLHSRARGTTTWVFSRSTRAPVGMTDNYLQSSRVRIAARVMGELKGGAEVVDTLEGLARSEYMHFVRWEAAESVYKIDPSRGAALLRGHLVNDAHPSIRKAARATLENIDAASGAKH
ncbi:MAG TPA: HEAT repeat domain-containing protein [Blastocatellia bacterium]|nr:HEAT repeat domain-containing protein [Blastocatellia bacterium]